MSSLLRSGLLAWCEGLDRWLPSTGYWDTWVDRMCEALIFFPCPFYVNWLLNCCPWITWGWCCWQHIKRDIGWYLMNRYVNVTEGFAIKTDTAVVPSESSSTRWHCNPGRPNWHHTLLCLFLRLGVHTGWVLAGRWRTNVGTWWTLWALFLSMLSFAFFLIITGSLDSRLIP